MGKHKAIGIVCGIGINDAEYVVQKWEVVLDSTGDKKNIQIWVCPFYQVWVSMLKRCYSDAYKKLYPTYIGASICEEWLTFSNFKTWMEKQDWEGKQLDKDIIAVGNKIYNPETCVFVSGNVNSFILDRTAARGKYMLGVCLHRQTGKFVANCRNPFTKVGGYLGLFATELEAHEAWRKRKHELAALLAKEQSDNRVAEALLRRYDSDVWYNKEC